MEAVRRFLRRLTAWILTVAAAVFAAVFAVNNHAPVEIDLAPLGPVLAVPLFALVLAGLAVGCGLAVVVGGLSLMRLRMRLARARREADEFARQVEHLRRRGADLEARLHDLEQGVPHRPGLPVPARPDAA